MHNLSSWTRDGKRALDNSDLNDRVAAAALYCTQQSQMEKTQ